MGKVTGYTAYDQSDSNAGLKDLFYIVKNTGSYASPIYDGDPAVSGRKITVEQFLDEQLVPRTIQVEFSAAEVKNMASTPVEVIPAPGINKIVGVVDVWATHKFGSIGFNGVGGTVEVITNGGSLPLFITTGNVMNQPSTTSRFSQCAVPINSATALPFGCRQVSSVATTADRTTHHCPTP